MSNYENDSKFEEADLGIKQQENKIKYIEDQAIIRFLVQHTQRKDIDLSKFKLPSYLALDEDENDENWNLKCKNVNCYIKE